MKTRSSSSDDLVPAGNSRESQLHFVDPTSSPRKSLHGLNLPRPSSRRSKGGVDDSVSESWQRSNLFQIVPTHNVEFCHKKNKLVFCFSFWNWIWKRNWLLDVCFRFIICAIEKCKNSSVVKCLWGSMIRFSYIHFLGSKYINSKQNQTKSLFTVFVFVFLLLKDRRSYASKGFHLPKGWTVEEFPRRNSYIIDKVELSWLI